MGQTPEQAERQIAAQGRTLQAIKDRIRWNVIGVERLYNSHAQNKEVFTAADARRLYDQYPGEFDLPERRRVSHILIAIAPDADAARQLAARTKAEAILRRVRAGEDFVALARAWSDDAASKDRGGDRGFSTRGIIVSPDSDPFGNVAFAMVTIGEVSDVVRTREGFHIIKLTGLEPARRQSFEEVQQRLIDDFHYREVARFWEDFGGKLTKRARIEWSPTEEIRQAAARERQRMFNEHVERLIAKEQRHNVSPQEQMAAGQEDSPDRELAPANLIPPSRAK